MSSLVLSPLIALASVVFVIGAVGTVWRRSLLVVLISLQLMLMAGELAFISFSVDRSADPDSAGVIAAAQGVVLTAIFVGLVQFSVGFIIVRRLADYRKSIDLEQSSALQG